MIMVFTICYLLDIVLMWLAVVSCMYSQLLVFLGLLLPIAHSYSLLPVIQTVMNIIIESKGMISMPILNHDIKAE